MNRENAFELLIYMVTSAAGLENEPRLYGPMRLMEASERLCRLMLEENPSDARLQELMDVIADAKHKSDAGEEEFFAAIGQVSAELVDFL